MPHFDVVTLGNAIVDVIAKTDEDFLIQNGIVKGAMNLVDGARAELLYKRMTKAIEMSGGSAANTAAGIASFGANVSFMGKVAADHLGQVFAHDLRTQGVLYDTKPLENSASTARSMIFVTPDGERSMNTYLGACVEFGPEDVEIAKILKSKIVYFEGYLWDPPRAKEAIRMAARIAHEAGNDVALTLSDSFCVDRYRKDFFELIRTGTVNIIFANEAEILSLYETSSIETAITAIRNDVRGFACITRGEKGAVIVTSNDIWTIDAFPVDKVVDVTGAGDLFATGFLYGHSQGMSMEACGKLGSFAASLVIQQVGPRLPFSLKEAATQKGLLE